MKKPFNPLWLLTLTPILIIYWLIILVIVFSLYNSRQSLYQAEKNLRSVLSDAGIQSEDAVCEYGDYTYFWGERTGSNYKMYFLNPANTSYSKLSTAIQSKGLASNSYYGSSISTEYQMTFTKQNLNGEVPRITTEIYTSGENVYINNKCTEMKGSTYVVPIDKEMLEITYSLD